MRSVMIGIFSWVVAAGAAELEVQVRLQDYANVPAVWLTKAKWVAAGILENAGVRLLWIHCSPNFAGPDALCDVPAGPIDLHVRVLSKKMARLVDTSSNSMGYAMLAGRFPSIASVFYHRAVDLEAGRFGARGEILGGILAHEIGHLLLAEHRHSRTGILQAEWGDEDLRMIAVGRLWFTPVQAARLVSRARERVRAQQSLEKFQKQSLLRAGRELPGELGRKRLN